MSREEKIARITDTFLGLEDHGIFTAVISLNYGDSGCQSAGNYCLGGDHGKSKSENDYGGRFIRKLLSACGVDSWEKLKGRTVIAIRESDLIIGIKPLPVDKGDEFIFKDLADEYKDKP